MNKRMTLPVAAESEDAHKLKPNEQARRQFITQILGGSLMLMTLPTLASTLFKRGTSEAEMQRVKQEYLEKCFPNAWPADR